MGYENDEIESIQRETIVERDDSMKKMVRGFEPKYLIIIGGLVLFAIFLVRENIIKKDDMYLYIGILILIVIFLAYKNLSGQAYLTLEEAKAIAQMFTFKEQKLKRIPDGELSVMPDSHLQWSGETPWKYTIGVYVQPREDTPKEYEVLVDPKRGGLGVIGLKWCKFGYRPQERRDIDWMQPPDWTFEKKHEEYLRGGKVKR